MKKIVQVR